MFFAASKFSRSFSGLSLTSPSRARPGSYPPDPEAGVAHPPLWEEPPGRSWNRRGRREAMALELLDANGGKIVHVKMSGRISKADYDRYLAVLDDRIRQHGKIRLFGEVDH